MILKFVCPKLQLVRCLGHAVQLVVGGVVRMPAIAGKHLSDITEAGVICESQPQTVALGGGIPFSTADGVLCEHDNLPCALS